MIVRELLTRIGYDVDPRAEQRVKRGFKRVVDAAGRLGFALSAGAVAIGFQRVLNAASDVEETLNVVETAFEDQTAAVLQWARTSGEAAGRSEFAMREYAATVGAVVGPTLGSAEATAELSANMAQLAVDLGSFFNATDDDALQALRSGLIGQSEPLLRFGVAMNVAALDAFALQQGIGKTTKQMTEAEKITLRYRFILANTTKAQGDAEKTAGSFANQLKRLFGNLRDLAVAIGKQVLPGAADFLVTLNDIVKAIKGPLISVLRLLTAPIKLVITTIAGLVVGLGQLNTVGKVVFSALLGAVLALKAPFIITFAIIGGLVVAAILIIEDLWLSLTEGRGVIAGVAGEFMAMFDETGSALEAFVGIFANAIDFWVEKLFGVEDATGKAGAAIRAGIGAALEFLGGLADEAAIKIIALQETLLDLPRAILEAFRNIIPNIRRLVAELPLAGGVSGLLGDVGRFVGDAVGLGGPVPGGAAAPGPGNVNAQQDINVTINAPGGDPQAIAAAAGPAVQRGAADANRRTAQQLLTGGAT